MAVERIGTVRSGGVELAVFEWSGAPAASGTEQPTVMLVHGYPDTHTVWCPLAERLVEHVRVLAYDVRGAGTSSAPRGRGRRGYHIDQLVDDQLAVLEEVTPGQRVHLVAHDWGSIQSWHTVTDRRAPRSIASYTTVSGPCLDHVSYWMRDSVRSLSPRRWAQAGDQLRRSWYAWWYQLPLAAPLAWRLGWANLVTKLLSSREGAEPTPPGTPASEQWPASTLPTDGRRGIELYRANFLPRLFRPEERRTEIPVQLLVASRDRYMSTALFKDLDRWVGQLWQRSLPSRHWVIRTHPDQVANWVLQLVEHVEAEGAGTG